MTEFLSRPVVGAQTIAAIRDTREPTSIISHYLPPPRISSSPAGTWTPASGNSSAFRDVYGQSNDLNNVWFEWDLVFPGLKPGENMGIHPYALSGPNLGNLLLTIDGTPANVNETWILYATSYTWLIGTYNTSHWPGIDWTKPAKRNLRFRINGKHASSTAHILCLANTMLTAVRTL